MTKTEIGNIKLTAKETWNWKHQSLDISGVVIAKAQRLANKERHAVYIEGSCGTILHSVYPESKQ